MEDRRRLKYLHDLSNDFDRMIDREGPLIGQTNSNDDSDGDEVWSVDGGVQSQSHDGTHAQSNIITQTQSNDIQHAQSNDIQHAQSNDLPAQSKDRDNSGSGNDDKSTVSDRDDDDVWTVSGGIMSTAVVHEQQLQQQLHGIHDQSNIITQTQSNDITHAQSNDLPSQSNDFHIQSNDLPSQSNDLLAQSNDLAPSLQSLAWRQWGKSIDWGRVHGQGSDIYILAQGNPPISTTPSRVMATPSRVIATPSRVISTPSRTTPTAIIRPLPRPQAAVQGLGHVDAQGQGLASPPHNVSVISLSSQLNSTHDQSNDHTASDSSIYSNGNSGTSISSLSTSPSPSIQNSNVVVNAAVTHTTTSACVGGTVDHVQSNNSTHAQSNITLVQSNEQPVLQVSSPLALALAVALVPVRQSPLLSAAASSTFGTPTLAQMAGQALHSRHKQPQYISDPRSHNNNNNKNSNSNNKKINDNKHSIVGTTTKQPPQPPPKPPPPHHHQLQPHHAHPHLPKPLRELEEERVWISTVLKRARDQVTPLCSNHIY